jgi:hypothetical protein
MNKALVGTLDAGDATCALIGMSAAHTDPVVASATKEIASFLTGASRKYPRG